MARAAHRLLTPAVLAAGLLASTAISAAASTQAQGAATSSPDSGVERSNPAVRVRRGMPEGYLGITFMCSVKQQYGPEGLTIYHYGYPAVASVAPGSPAQQAGIVPGDTIVAYDSEDVLYRKIVLAKLLRPGNQVAVRVRRNGWIKELSVRIARRPPTFVDMNVLGDPAPRRLPAPAAAPATSASSGQLGTPVSRAAHVAPALPEVPDVDVAAAPIPGIEVVRTNDDLRDALGVPGGLLVITVEDHTTAADAGIRAGDVIVSAAGESIDASDRLAEIVQHAESGQQVVELRVVRRHKARTVLIR